MEETKMEKQNRMLKVILLVLLIPVVSGITILAYHFLVKPSGSDDFASKDKKIPEVSRGEPNNEKASPSPTTATTPAIVNAAAQNTAAAPPANPNPPAPANPNPVKSLTPFVGKWLMIGRDKITYIFESPKKAGGSESGIMRVTTAGGKSYDSTYTNISRELSEFEVNGTTYSYEVGGNGETLKLEYDGNILRFNRLK